MAVRLGLDSLSQSCHLPSVSGVHLYSQSAIMAAAKTPPRMWAHVVDCLFSPERFDERDCRGPGDAARSRYIAVPATRRLPTIRIYAHPLDMYTYILEYRSRTVCVCLERPQ